MQQEATRGPQAALFSTVLPLGPRRWLLPALLSFLVLAPLIRWGLPTSQIGALPLHPELASQLPLPDLYTTLLGSSEFGYKFFLGLSSLLSIAAVAWAAYRWWGSHSWWLTALWVSAPLHLILVFQMGWPHRLVGVAFLAVGLGLLRARSAQRWLSLPPLLAGGLLLWEWSSAVPPADLLRPLAGPWEADLWLAVPAAPLPVVPLLLALIVATLLWEQRQRLSSALTALALVVVGIGLALWGGPVLFGASLATLGLVLAAGALPALDSRYGTWPVTVAVVTLAALSTYPAFQPPWQDEPPEAHGQSALFGEAQMALLSTTLSDDGAALEVAWQLVSPVNQPLTVFVHLLDESGSIVAQADTPLLDESGRATSEWPVGTLITQRYPLDSPAPPESVSLGLYDPATETRVPVPSGGDSVSIPLR